MPKTGLLTKWAMSHVANNHVLITAWLPEVTAIFMQVIRGAGNLHAWWSTRVQ